MLHERLLKERTALDERITYHKQLQAQMQEIQQLLSQNQIAIIGIQARIQILEELEEENASNNTE